MLENDGAPSSSISARPAGLPAAVIVNADDWGADVATTNRILDCIQQGVVSSASAMVFTSDAARAADLAREHNIDTGLHLNLTTPFSASGVPSPLLGHQQKLARALRSHRFAPAFYHPLLASSFDYVIKQQLEEYARLYGAPPARIDGHHHMHLSTNVLLRKLLPARTIVRRNFTFRAHEKVAINRLYRGLQDRVLDRRHWTTDYFFNLVPLDKGRLKTILELARHASVELEVHPGRIEEYEFLMNRQLFACTENLEVIRGYHLRRPAAECAVPRIQQASAPTVPHIAVCICTFKRPEMLKRLLTDLAGQRTDSAFTYSIVVADNDDLQSAAPVIEEMRRLLPVPIKYCAEPARGIARARNRVVTSAQGDFLAFIDDDEFPESDWLFHLFRTFQRYDVSGVLGPVRRFLEPGAPAWLRKSSLYDRPVNPTGLEVKWRESRTGNVLIRSSIIAGEDMPFRPEFIAGEDQDFFRRKIEMGHRFIWSSSAVVHELLPQSRWKRGYYVRKAMLQGGYAARQPDCGALAIAKSVIAVPLYTAALPLALLGGQHRFMTLLTKLSDHAGKLLSVMKINPIREEYVSD